MLTFLYMSSGGFFSWCTFVTMAEVVSHVFPGQLKCALKKQIQFVMCNKFLIFATQQKKKIKHIFGETNNWP